jgi:enamine deaminase RidA (YjgF/YER057c/UK114 family)
MTPPRSPSERLAALGLELPPVPGPLAAYRPAVRSGSLVFTAGQLPLAEGRLIAVGPVVEAVTEPVAGDPVSGPTGDSVAGTVTLEQARAAAAQCALNALAAVAEVAGDLDNVQSVVKMVGYVCSGPGFTAQPTVLDGASELVGAVFADATSQGHARSAVGVAVLPLGASVEIELTAMLRVAGDQ